MKLNFGKEGIEILNPGGVLLAIGAGLAQFFQTKHMIGIMKAKKEKESKDRKEERGKRKEGEFSNNNPDVNKGDMNEMAEIMNKQMLYFFPFLTVFIGLTFPAGLALYWITSTLLMIGQQWMLDRK